MAPPSGARRDVEGAGLTEPSYRLGRRVAVASDGPQRPRRPGPVDVERGAGEGSPPADLGGAEHEDAVRLGGTAGLRAPQLGHLAQGRHVVEGDTGESIAFGLGRLLP